MSRAFLCGGSYSQAVSKKGANHLPPRRLKFTIGSSLERSRLAYFSPCHNIDVLKFGSVSESKKELGHESSVQLSDQPLSNRY